MILFYVLVTALSLFSTTHTNTLSWQELLTQHEQLINGTAIQEQHKMFADGQAPIIVDLRIKSIPISENNESLIDLNEIKHPRITMLPNPEYPFASPHCNSGYPSACKMRKTVFEKLEIMLDKLDLLAPKFGYEPEQIEIRIFEALRGLDTQLEIYLNKMAEIKEQKPELSTKELELEASKWVSPVKNNVPVHSTGAAIDIQLWDNKNQVFVDMGMFGAIWGKNECAPTFSENCSDLQKMNRLFCLLAAAQAGLTNYVYEWWHYSSGDRYAAFWQEQDEEKRVAVYGAVN